MNEPMTKNLKGLAELGLASPSVPVEFGGAGLPFTVTMMIGEMLARADLSTQVQHGIGWNFIDGEKPVSAYCSNE